MINRLFIATAFIASLAVQAPALAQEVTPHDELACASVPNFKSIQEALKKGFKKTGTKIKAAAVKYPLLLTYHSLVALGVSTKYILEAYEMSTQTGTVFIDCLFTVLCDASYLTTAHMICAYALIPATIFDI